ncbi:hypothetical protein AB205_0213780, partial [Aquarana catesbeiana]
RSLVHCSLDGVGHQNTLFRVSDTGAPVDTRGLSMCENCTKKVSIPALEREKKCLLLGTLPKKTIVRNFQAMFPIPISGLKYLCAKYTFFYSHRGEKTRDI